MSLSKMILVSIPKISLAGIYELEMYNILLNYIVINKVIGNMYFEELENRIYFKRSPFTLMRDKDITELNVGFLEETDIFLLNLDIGSVVEDILTQFYFKFKQSPSLNLSLNLETILLSKSSYLISYDTIGAVR